MSVEDKVKKFIEEQKLIREGDKILLGLSGGADSVSLFYLLLTLRAEFGFTLRAAHIHHGIRPEAEQDVSYVKALCEKEGVPCDIFREDVPAYAKEKGLSEEEAGRLLRYLDFEKSLTAWQRKEDGEKTSYKMATAHHENDQAETVLFQLFRGCGLSGLRGMLPKRENIIRPMLHLSREEIESYLKEKGISWCEDKTNALEDYSRNKIRHRILAYAEEQICSGAAAHIGNTARIVGEAESYIKRQTEAAHQRICVERGGALVFDIASFLQEDVFLQKQLLFHGFEKISPSRKDIGAVHVEKVLSLIRKQGNGELHLPGGLQARKSYQHLLLFRKSEGDAKTLPEILPEDKGFLYGEEKPAFQVTLIDLSEEENAKAQLGIQDIFEFVECIPEKKYTKWFDYDKIETSFCARHPKSGDYLTIDAEMNHKSFRRYMIETKIPVSYRSSLWLFADDAHIMWAPGGRMSAYYKVTKQTKTILQITICGEE